MKKLIIVITAVALFAACSKKQDQKPVITLTPQTATIKDLTGAWTLTTDSTFVTNNGQTTTTVAASNNNSQFIFKADGTGLETAGTDTTETFTYTVASGIVMLHIAATGSSPASDLPLTIRVITANKLTLREGSGTVIIDLLFIKN